MARQTATSIDTNALHYFLANGRYPRAVSFIAGHLIGVRIGGISADAPVTLERDEAEELLKWLVDNHPTEKRA